MRDKVIWYGHATMGVETNGYKLVVDPFFTDNPMANITADQIDPDFILVSHGHGDHIGDAASISKRTGAMIISNNEIAVWLEKQGLRTHGQHLGGGYKHPFGYLKLTLALHGSILPDGSYGGNPCGFLLTTNIGSKIYFACDTGLFGDMKLIGEEGIDLAVLPIGDNYTMGPADALRAVKLLQPQRVIPIHYNTWDIIAQDPKEWAKQVHSNTSTEVSILKPGEFIELNK